MALQDLTPQLRTRLSRMERAVGWFVLLATALLIFGFGYYVHSMAKRKGWFKTRASYFTYVKSADGLKIGDPVFLMGSEAGQITDVQPEAPGSFYNVYVEFEIREPHYGYLWTSGSRTKVQGDFLGKRILEVTKGTNGHAIYQFHPLGTLTRAELGKIQIPNRWLLAADLYDTDKNLLVKARTPLNEEALKVINQLRLDTIPVLDTSQARKSPTAVWDDKAGTYTNFISKLMAKENLKANLYWLVADEAASVSDQAQELMLMGKQALPGILALTNDISATLSNANQLMLDYSRVSLGIQPVISNIDYITTQLREPGGFSRFVLETNTYQNLNKTLESVNHALSGADTNFPAALANLRQALSDISRLSTNLNAHLQSDTNVLGEFSQTAMELDSFLEGLKRHWLLRSAFKPGKTNPPVSSPKGSESR